jgi:hypothetical protein
MERREKQARDERMGGRESGEGKDSREREEREGEEEKGCPFLCFMCSSSNASPFMLNVISL